MPGTEHVSWFIGDSVIVTVGGVYQGLGRVVDTVGVAG